MSEETTTRKRSPIRLNAGVTRQNLRIFYFAGFMAATLMVYVSLSKSFLFNTFLKIPPGEQGRVAGDLQTFREIIVLVAISLGGLLADKLSRRLVFVVGFLCLGVSYFLFPFATNVQQLMGFYLINGVGAAFITGMLATILADYVSDADRGKAGGTQGMLAALSGLFFMQLLLALPNLLNKQMGLTLEAAGRVSYMIIAGLALVTAGVCWFGLQKQNLAQSAQRKSFFALLGEGVAAAKAPGVALAYAAAFVSRGDLVVVGTFLTIWISKAAVAQGMDPAQAFARAIPILLVSTVAQIVCAPLIGRLTDRVSRVTALAIAAVIGAIGYGAMIFVSNPLGTGLLVIAVLLGAAQISGIITSQVLIAQYAPPEVRGSVIGVFGLCGALAQIALAKFGGVLFDRWTEAAPFVLVGALNLLLVIIALLIRNHASLQTTNVNEAVPLVH
jgi:MFS family permease